MHVKKPANEADEKRDVCSVEEVADYLINRLASLVENWEEKNVCQEWNQTALVGCRKNSVDVIWPNQN